MYIIHDMYRTVPLLTSSLINKKVSLSEGVTHTRERKRQGRKRVFDMPGAYAIFVPTQLRKMTVPELLEY